MTSWPDGRNIVKNSTIMKSKQTLNKESQHHYDKEPPILKDEVIAAIEKLKNNKSPETNNITAEHLKAGGEPVINILYKTNNMILESGEQPDKWTESIMIPLKQSITQYYVSQNDICG